MAIHLPLICFIVCDSGPTTHFTEFTKYLVAQEEVCVHMYASGPAQVKLQGLPLPDGIHLFHFMLNGLTREEEQNLATEIVNKCVTRGAQAIIVDIANKFDIKLQEAFNKLNDSLLNIRFWCYYDNLDAYVPGGYSARCGEMIKLSQNILFANMSLIKSNSHIFSSPDVIIDCNGKNSQGIGYYPIEIAERLAKRREIERETLREKYGWNNVKYLFVYFGGNNQVYYKQAFPAFLSFLSHINRKLSKDIGFFIHQHPAAKIQNHDGLLFQKWSLKNRHIRATLSSLTSDEAQLIADGILYYQTSMAPQFALIGLPILQVGHEIYEDILVRHHLCETATNSTELKNGLEALKKPNQSSNSSEQKQLIYNAIGYTSDWPKNLRRAILDLE